MPTQGEGLLALQTTQRPQLLAGQCMHTGLDVLTRPTCISLRSKSDRGANRGFELPPDQAVDLASLPICAGSESPHFCASSERMDRSNCAENVARPRQFKTWFSRVISSLWKTRLRCKRPSRGSLQGSKKTQEEQGHGSDVGLPAVALHYRISKG